jgi:hypothetical protein
MSNEIEMGVSDVTAEIAASIAHQRAPLSPREAYLVFILKGMPLFRDIRRFDLFDKAYREVAPDEGSATEQLIDAVYWLGADCFYGAFDEASVRRYFTSTLVPLLAKENVPVPVSPDLSDW